MEPLDAEIVTLQDAMSTGRLGAAELAAFCLDRIAALGRAGPCLRAVVELNRPHG